jgi:hypothetical protein
VQSDGTRYVAIEASDTDAHVRRVSPLLKQSGEQPDKNPDADDAPTRCQNVFDRCHGLSPSSDVLPMRGLLCLSLPHLISLDQIHISYLFLPMAQKEPIR